MPIPSALVTRFFQFVVNRQFAEAERELGRIQERMHDTEWNTGYSRALHGMLIARRSNNDQYTFLSKLGFNDKKILQTHRREFRAHVKSKLHENFDRGFFSAWADFMRVLGKLASENPNMEGSRPTTRKPATTSAAKVKLELKAILAEKPDLD